MDNTGMVTNTRYSANFAALSFYPRTSTISADTCVLKCKSLLSHAIRLGLLTTVLIHAAFVSADGDTLRYSVALFSELDQKGEKLFIDKDEVLLGDSAFHDGTLSADIPEGWEVVFYKDPDFNGDHWTRRAGKHNLPGDAHVSAVKIKKKPNLQSLAAYKVVLFTEPGQEGTKAFMSTSDSSLSDEFLDNFISSFKIPYGWQIRFYQHANFEGLYWTRNFGQGDLPSAAKISSIQILKQLDPDAEVVIRPNDGEDLHLPDDVKRIRVEITDNRWAEYIYLPKSAPTGATVTLLRESLNESYVKMPDGTESMLVPPNSEVVFVWDGKAWVHTITKTGNTTKLDNIGFFEIGMSNTQPAAIESVVTTISQTTPLEKPGFLNLANISIEEGVISNNTNYSVGGIYVERDGVPYYLEFSSELPAYSSTHLSEEWRTSHYVNMAQLGKTQYNFNPSLVGGRPEARLANEQERDSAEQVYRYEHYWLNNPKTLATVIDRVAEQCDINEGYSECKNYSKPRLEYASDMYFAQSVSGLTSNFRIDPSTWGLATQPGKNLVKSTVNSIQNVWMSPDLVANMLSENKATAIDAEQGLIHEYFHNLGFSHSSGWASHTGIDDLFGAKAYEYRTELGDNYYASNLVVQATKTDALTYTFSTYGLGDITDLKMRLLSTQDLSAEVTESDNSNQVTIQFDKMPETDVHVSLYSQESSQMATVTLTDFVTEVSGLEALSNLNNTFAALVDQYTKVFIYTANGAWVRDFNLPEGKEGHMIIFQSNAGRNSNIYYDGRTDVLPFKSRIEYIYTNGHWVRQ